MISSSLVGPVEHFALVAVVDAQHLLAVDFVAAALLPDLGRLDGRHQQLERAGAVLLLAHDLLDLAQDAEAQAEATNRCRRWTGGSAGPEHQPMRDDLGFLGIVAEERQEIAAEAHGHLIRALGRMRGRAARWKGAMPYAEGPALPRRPRRG